MNNTNELATYIQCMDISGQRVTFLTISGDRVVFADGSVLLFTNHEKIFYYCGERVH